MLSFYLKNIANNFRRLYFYFLIVFIFILKNIKLLINYYNIKKLIKNNFEFTY